jgi:hypothetical protein
MFNYTNVLLNILSPAIRLRSQSKTQSAGSLPMRARVMHATCQTTPIYYNTTTILLCQITFYVCQNKFDDIPHLA